MGRLGFKVRQGIPGRLAVCDAYDPFISVDNFDYFDTSRGPGGDSASGWGQAVPPHEEANGGRHWHNRQLDSL
jgi:hypothetical protein